MNIPAVGKATLKLMGICMAALAVVVLPGVLIIFYINWTNPVKPRKHVSPDGRFVVELEPWRGFPDKNFSIRIGENRGGASKRTVYRSGDRDYLKVDVRERILWSKDSTKFLLLSPGFSNDRGRWLSKGESLFLLYDFSDAKVYCNSDNHRYPPFSFEDIELFDFGEKLEPGPDPYADVQGKALPRPN